MVLHVTLPFVWFLDCLLFSGSLDLFLSFMLLWLSISSFRNDTDGSYYDVGADDNEFFFDVD